MAQRLTRVRPVALVTFGHVEGDVVHSQYCVLDLLPQFAAVSCNIDEQAETLARTQLQNCDNAFFVRRHDLNGDKAQAASIWEYLSTESAI